MGPPHLARLGGSRSPEKEAGKSFSSRAGLKNLLLSSGLGWIGSSSGLRSGEAAEARGAPSRRRALEVHMSSETKGNRLGKHAVRARQQLGFDIVGP